MKNKAALQIADIILEIPTKSFAGMANFGQSGESRVVKVRMTIPQVRVRIVGITWHTIIR